MECVVIALVWLATVQKSNHVLLFLILGAQALWVWLLLRPAVSPGRGWVVAVFFMLRLPWLFHLPKFSDDLYRHIWESRVFFHGLNPYSFAPDHPSLGFLRTGLFEFVNHKSLASIYSPGAFVLGWLAQLQDSVAIWKATLVSFEALALCAFLKTSHRAAWLWALCPLAVVFGAADGHLDVLGALLTCGSGVWLSSALKLTAVPVILATEGVRLFNARDDEPHSRTRFLLGILFCLLMSAPVLTSTGFQAFARSWEGGAAIYPELRALLLHTPLAEYSANIYAGSVARVITAFIFMACAFMIIKTTKDYNQRGLAIVIAGLLTSSMVHPWYWVWCLPFALLLIVGEKETDPPKRLHKTSALPWYGLWFFSTGLLNENRGLVYIPPLLFFLISTILRRARQREGLKHQRARQ